MAPRPKKNSSTREGAPSDGERRYFRARASAWFRYVFPRLRKCEACHKRPARPGVALWGSYCGEECAGVGYERAIGKATFAMGQLLLLVQREERPKIRRAMEVAIVAGRAMEAGADARTHEAVERMWYALTKRQIGGSKTEAYRDIFYALKSARTFAKIDVNPTPTDEERAARLVEWLPCTLPIGAARSIIAAKRRPLTALVREVLLHTSREERKRLGFLAVPKQAEITTALRKHVELG